MIVRHSQGQYSITTASEQTLVDRLRGQLIVTDEGLARNFNLPESTVLILPPGEKNKSLECYGRVCDWLLQKGATRKSTLYALGGGVIGDLVGFVAATYMRGVPYVQIPTTLLAQVDSSVGGKVGIDHGPSKNLLGAFNPPTEVLLCEEILRTLPARQIRNGLAEVLKYGFISNPEILELLQPQAMPSAEIVQICIRAKIDVVEQDEFELNGIRATLNFGHTVAHALESCLNYEGLLHGEAVAIGMVVEAKLGEKLGITPASVSQRVEKVVTLHGLPSTHPLLAEPARMVEAMKRDKKRTKCGIPFSFLTDLGKCKLFEEIEESFLLKELTRTK